MSLGTVFTPRGPAPIQVDAYVSTTWYFDHVAPVWLALPSALRGIFAVHHQMLAYARAHGVPQAQYVTHTFKKRPNAVIVAAWGDLKWVRHRPAILMEHGAGQSYDKVHPSYAGGPGRKMVGLFLNPSERVARLNARSYPRTTQAVIGCPKLDPWHRRSYERHDPPVVALSWHWSRYPVVPEVAGSFPHYRSALASLAASRFKILGHGHPRLFNEPDSQLAKTYAEHGIEVVRSFAEVLDRADVYVCDNSSTLFEFASTGRPVVVMNAPHYRREVSHGLRFWECADVGVQVDGPADLLAGIEQALKDPKKQRARREQITAEVYGVHDGSAAQTAASAIADWLGVRAEARAA